MFSAPLMLAGSMSETIWSKSGPGAPVMNVWWNSRCDYRFIDLLPGPTATDPAGLPPMFSASPVTVLTAT